MNQAFSEQLREMYEADRDALYGYAVAITGDRGAAEARGVPLHTAASWYRRGLEKLRAMLAKEGT